MGRRKKLDVKNKLKKFVILRILQKSLTLTFFRTLHNIPNFQNFRKISILSFFVGQNLVFINLKKLKYFFKFSQNYRNIFFLAKTENYLELGIYLKN